jgi:hypothetical protein
MTTARRARGGRAQSTRLVATALPLLLDEELTPEGGSEPSLPQGEVPDLRGDDPAETLAPTAPEMRLEAGGLPPKPQAVRAATAYDALTAWARGEPVRLTDEVNAALHILYTRYGTNHAATLLVRMNMEADAVA